MPNWVKYTLLLSKHRVHGVCLKVAGVLEQDGKELSRSVQVKWASRDVPQRPKQTNWPNKTAERTDFSYQQQ